MKPRKKKFAVPSVWDAEARVWVATSRDVPGLVLEASSLDKLTKEVALLVPQLLALQTHPAEGKAPTKAVPIKISHQHLVEMV